ncbi:MAG: hypothetical protein ACW98U_00425 [Candidatus Thorarchaeota archaeon]
MRRYSRFILLSLLVASVTVPAIVDNVAASSINIIDYDLEGIYADTTQYYVLWVRGDNTVPLEVNASVLEFVGSTGWPQLSIEVFDYEDYHYRTSAIADCRTLDNYTCRLNFDASGHNKYVVAMKNLDLVDDAVYNLTISSPDIIDFQYTSIFDLDDIIDPQSNTISITYFHSTNPYLFRLEGSGDSRVVAAYFPYLSSSPNDELYFMIYNKGNTSDLFVGILGLPYIEPYPSLTAFIIDFEDYEEENKEVLYLWTVSNYSSSGTFSCESGHRYNFWIDIGSWEPDLYIVFDTFGNEELNLETDLLAENPEGVVSLILSFIDPWQEYRNLQRDIFNYTLGIGGLAAGGSGVFLFAIWYYRRRYH